MRIHTDRLTFADVYAAARDAGAAVEGCSRHGSRTRGHAFEVRLTGSSKRRPNFYDGSGVYAATWDQWGVFLGALYRVDPDAVCGSGKSPVYADADAFHAATFTRFADGWPADAHGDHRFAYAGIPRVQACTKCSARQTWADHYAVSA